MSYDHENQRYTCPVIDDGPHSDAVFMLTGPSDISYAGYACSNCIAKYRAGAGAAPPPHVPYVPSPVLGGTPPVSVPDPVPAPVPPAPAPVFAAAPVVASAPAPAPKAAAKKR